MGIIVRHIKGTNLPEYVFDGDTRPRKVASKRTKNKHADAADDSATKKAKADVPVDPTPAEAAALAQ